MRLIYGAGGHGRVLLDTLRTLGQEPDGFIDDGKVGQVVDGMQVYGNDVLPQCTGVFHGIGYIALRRRIGLQLAERGLVAGTVVHPNATISPTAQIGEGTVIYAGVVVNTGARIGRGVILNTGCVVEHDAVVGDWAHISPNATLGGAAEIGEATWCGINSAVLPLIRVGSETILGAGAVAVRNIPDRVVAVGVPARVAREHTIA